MERERMRIVVFGANGRTGRVLIDQALTAGHRVVAVTRRPQSIPPQEGLTVAAASAADADAVAAAVAGSDAVLSVLAVPYSRKPVNLFSLSAANIIAAMQRHKVQRLIAVSSAIADPDWRPSGAFFFNRVVNPLILKKLGRTLYDDIRRMESLVRASALDWTLIRPSGLFNTAAVTDYKIAENSADGQYTARADLAACMLHQLNYERYICKTIGVITTAIKPSIVQLMLLWSEAFKRERKR